jgi:chloramphenicol 3-O phosphotransferase
VDGGGADRQGGTVLYLNGTTSSGKTTLAAALHARLPGPWLRLEGDRFFAMLSRDHARMTNAVVSSLHAFAAAAAASGLSVVVDGLLTSRTWLADAAEKLAGHRAFLVAVRCPLDELERREAARGDRRVGAARSQYDLIHAHGTYDLELDTSLASAEQCAERVAAMLEGAVEPTAFRRLLDSEYLRDEAAYGWVLMRGDRGPGVRRLQEDLRRLGHDPGPPDGVFGESTEAALRAFQERHGVPADGVLWPRTVAAIITPAAASPPRPRTPPSP